MHLKGSLRGAARGVASVLRLFTTSSTTTIVTDEQLREMRLAIARGSFPVSPPPAAAALSASPALSSPSAPLSSTLEGRAHAMLRVLAKDSNRLAFASSLLRDLTSEASRQADLEHQELPPHPPEIDLCGERFDDSIEAKLKDVQSANKTLLDRISQCEPSVRKFLLGE